MEETNVSYYYEFEDRHRILLAVAYGSVGENELRELYFDMRARKDEEHALTGILDLTGVTTFDVDAQIISGLASHPPNFDDPTLRAVVAPTDLLFGMSRMFQLLGSRNPRRTPRRKDAGRGPQTSECQGSAIPQTRSSSLIKCR